MTLKVRMFGKRVRWVASIVKARTVFEFTQVSELLLSMLSAFICMTCGTQYPPSQEPPTSCDICEDERQFVNPRGQTWTSLDEIRKFHRAVISRYEVGLYGIGATPELAIGERALLVCSTLGNVLWDCLALLDDAIVDFIRALGGLSAIAISHPHFYTTMTEWSRLFGGAPIYLHRSNKSWVRLLMTPQMSPM